MKKTFILLSVAAVFGVAMFSTTSCKKSSSSTPTMTLYDSLGGTTMVADPASTNGGKIEAGRLAIQNVVDSSIFVIAGDASLKGHFTVLLGEVGAGNFTGFTALSKNLTDFIATAVGAKDYTYTGKSMVAAHDPAQNPRMNGKATNADMTQFETDVVAGANQNKVPAYLINRLGQVLETVRTQVVQQ